MVQFTPQYHSRVPKRSKTAYVHSDTSCPECNSPIKGSLEMPRAPEFNGQLGCCPGACSDAQGGKSGAPVRGSPSEVTPALGTALFLLRYTSRAVLVRQ